MAVNVILDGDNSSAIKELQDLTILASVEKGFVTSRITTDQLTLVNEFAQKAREFIENGANGNGPGIFEGMPIEIIENGNSIFEGCLDFINDFAVVDPTTVKTRLRKKNSNNSIADQMSGTTFASLEERGFINSSHFIDVPFVIEKDFNFIDFAFLAFSIYSIVKDLRDIVKEVIQSLPVSTTAHAVGGATGPAAAAVFAAAKVLINAAFAVLLVIMLIDMVQQLLVYLISPVKYHKAMKVKTLLQIGFASLGLQYNTSIPELNDMSLTILPSKNNIDKNDHQYKLLNNITIHHPGKGYPSPSDYGYTLSELVDLVNTTFYAEYTIKNGVFEQHEIGSPWWLQQASYVLPPVLNESQVYNVKELASDFLLTFRTDVKDVNTLENFAGTTFEVHTRPVTQVHPEYNLMKGFEKIEIPYALGNRKEGLNNFEEIVKTLFEKIDNLINFFGGSGNWAQQISGRVGMLMLENDMFDVPKLLRLDNQNKMFINNRLYFSARFLYINHYYAKSFVLDNFYNQYQLFKGVRVPFGPADFDSLSENAYFYDSDGNICKLESVEWNISKDFAVMDYRVKKTYTVNLEEHYIEEGGSGSIPVNNPNF